MSSTTSFLSFLNVLDENSHVLQVHLKFHFTNRSKKWYKIKMILKGDHFLMTPKYLSVMMRMK